VYHKQIDTLRPLQNTPFCPISASGLRIILSFGFLILNEGKTIINLKFNI